MEELTVDKMLQSSLEVYESLLPDIRSFCDVEDDDASEIIKILDDIGYIDDDEEYYHAFFGTGRVMYPYMETKHMYTMIPLLVRCGGIPRLAPKILQYVFGYYVPKDFSHSIYASLNESIFTIINKDARHDGVDPAVLGNYTQPPLEDILGSSKKLPCSLNQPRTIFDEEIEIRGKKYVFYRTYYPFFPLMKCHFQDLTHCVSGHENVLIYIVGLMLSMEADLEKYQEKSMYFMTPDKIMSCRDILGRSKIQPRIKLS